MRSDAARTRFRATVTFGQLVAVDGGLACVLLSGRTREGVEKADKNGQHLWSPNVCNRTLQTGQSEYLAVDSMVGLSSYLRPRGSPESKPVGAAPLATGVEG